MIKKEIRIFFLILILRIFATANAQPGTNIQSMYKEALFLCGQSKFARAELLFKRIIKTKPDFYKAYLRFVDLSIQTDRLAITEQYFKSLLQTDPKNYCAYHGLGKIFFVEKKYQKAYENYVKAIRLNFDYFPVYPDFVDANLNIEEAKKNFELIISTYPENAAAHYGLAYIYGLQGNYDREFLEAQKALELNPDINRSYLYVADANYWQGNYSETIDICEEGIRTALDGRDFLVQIELQNLKAIALNKNGETVEALRLLQKSLNLAQKTGDPVRFGQTAKDFASIYWYISQFREALHYAKIAQKINHQFANTVREASDLNYIGIFLAEMGNYSEAIQTFEQARDLYLKINNRGAAAVCNGNMAGIYIELGQEQKAIPLIEQSIKIAREFKSFWLKSEAMNLGFLGDIYRNSGDFNKSAQKYNEALSIVQRMKTEPHQESYFLNKLGELFQKEGNYQLALDYYNQAMGKNARIFRKSTQALNLINIGYLYYLQANLTQAESYFQKALSIGKEGQQIELIWKSKAALGLVYQKQQKLEISQKFFTEAVEHIETISSGLQLEEFKTGFLQNTIEVYSDLISVLFQRHQQNPAGDFDKLAFNYAEKAKARTLLDMIYQGRLLENLVQQSPQTKTELSLLEKKIIGIEKELSAAFNSSDSSQAKKTFTELSEKKAKLLRERNKLRQKIVKANPAYQQLTEPPIFSVFDLQQIIPATQTVLEYLIGRENIYVWIISKNNLVFEKIDLTATELKEVLQKASPIFSVEKTETAHQVDHRWANFNENELQKLYQKLIGDVVQFEKNSELIIIPDGILHYFPFETLVTNKTDGKAHFLIEDHAISYSPSASLLNPDLFNQKKAVKNLLAVGNPDFGNKPKLGVIHWIRSMLPVSDILRGDHFAPLPFSETEVKEIYKYFPNSTVLIQKKATEEQVKKLAGDYKFIHLATHNIAEDKQPLYSKIILAQTGQSEEDGFLQTYEIYKMKLNAQLVVLSGCNTGLGKLYKGEGLIGMTRAFFYAGASSLVVSLWPVQDESTAFLMQNFYKNIKNGLPKNIALQKAKITLLHAKDVKNNPFYWGPFVLIGDWGEVK